jgi:hypothetical protein
MSVKYMRIEDMYVQARINLKYIEFKILIGLVLIDIETKSDIDKLIMI